MDDVKYSAIKQALFIGPLDSSSKRVRDTIEKTLREIGFSVIHPDEITDSGTRVAEIIIKAIESAEMIVVDLSRQNPNVLYELGYAHALSKPTLLIVNTDDISTIPSDIAGTRLLFYDTTNLSSLREQIKRQSRPILDDLRRRDQ